MSPTKFAVLMIAADQRLERARLAKDTPGTRAALAEQMSLLRSYYGSTNLA